jgi:hypothetical protein
MQIGSRTTGGLIAVQVLKGGTGYSAPPTVSINGGGGTGAAGVAVMAGTVVDSVIITNQGTGYTGSPTVGFTATSGAGASAVAYAYTGSLRPVSLFKGRFGDVYGVDGMGRGFRWTGGTANIQPIGIHKPAIGPAMTAASTDLGGRITAIQLVDGGAGYHSVPTVTLTGGTPTTPASAAAVISQGRVVDVIVREPGAGYQTNPIVSFSGGIGTGATFGVTAPGQVVQLNVLSGGTGYVAAGTQAPAVVVSSSQGLTGFHASVVVDAGGRVSDVFVTNAGTGATTTPTFAVTAASGTGAAVVPVMRHAVEGVTIISGGTGFFTPPFISFQARSNDREFNGNSAAATCTVNSTGSISAVTVTAPGAYGIPPDAVVLDSSARAQASVGKSMRGKYLCAIRYIDATDQIKPAAQRQPVPSSISELKEVDTGDGSSVLTWAFSHPYTDDRVVAMELWRTSGDQSLLLFRVATILKTDPEWSTTYTDTLADNELTDASRAEFGLMPITLPSGQINARRFEVPAGKYTVAAMFQDRAWYAGDSTGSSPNSLYYSEIDEPESVPLANELVVQENTDTPDLVVALVPLGPSLLVVQKQHIYKLMYVAQPIIDASITLAAHRGVLNSRCWTLMAGVAFLADSVGVYAFDGNTEQSISAAVDDFWRNGVIDFTKSEKFHVSSDYVSRTVRFHYCKSGDTEPVRALCYCTATQAWWEEVYATAVTATCPTVLSSQLRRVMGGADGVWRKSSGTNDSSTAVSYALRTGNVALTADPDRSIEVVYDPTVNDANLSLGLHYNNSPTARPNVIASDIGSGFTVTAGGNAVLNMKKTRSSLGDATGSAAARFSGRKSDRSAGGDQHIAVAVSGQQGSDPVAIHTVRVRGAE